MTHVRLYSDELRHALPDMKLAVADAIPTAACASSALAYCGVHNRNIDGIYANGGHVVFQAAATRSGNLVTVYVKGPDQGGIIISNPSTGVSTFLASISNAVYSEFSISVGKKIPVN